LGAARRTGRQAGSPCYALHVEIIVLGRPALLGSEAWVLIAILYNSEIKEIGSGEIKN